MTYEELIANLKDNVYKPKFPQRFLSDTHEEWERKCDEFSHKCKILEEQYYNDLQVFIDSYNINMTINDINRIPILNLNMSISSVKQTKVICEVVRDIIERN